MRTNLSRSSVAGRQQGKQAGSGDKQQKTRDQQSDRRSRTSKQKRESRHGQAAKNPGVLELSPAKIAKTGGCTKRVHKTAHRS
jgi:hypothetical protein